jgi:hypothetical protein
MSDNRAAAHRARPGAAVPSRDTRTRAAQNTTEG